jgi:hypothetical protein
MADDTRDYIDKSRAWGALTAGHSAEEADDLAPSRFALMGMQKRAAVLDAIDASASKGELPIEDLRSAMSKADLRHRLGQIHAQLRSRGR